MRFSFTCIVLFQNVIMEPIIPVNVTGEMLSDASMTELNLNGPSLAHSTLTHDEAIAAVGRLSAENSCLKGIHSLHALSDICYTFCIFIYITCIWENTFEWMVSIVVYRLWCRLCTHLLNFTWIKSLLSASFCQSSDSIGHLARFR